MKQIIKITLLMVLIAIPEWVVAKNSNSTHTYKTDEEIEGYSVKVHPVMEF